MADAFDRRLHERLLLKQLGEASRTPLTLAVVVQYQGDTWQAHITAGLSTELINHIGCGLSTKSKPDALADLIKQLRAKNLAGTMKIDRQDNQN